MKKYNIYEKSKQVHTIIIAVISFLMIGWCHIHQHLIG